eukprot:Filipodium_phascolosomae@DN2281_c0_g1_i2.p1
MKRLTSTCSCIRFASSTCKTARRGGDELGLQSGEQLAELLLALPNLELLTFDCQLAGDIWGPFVRGSITKKWKCEVNARINDWAPLTITPEEFARWFAAHPQQSLVVLGIDAALALPGLLADIGNGAEKLSHVKTIKFAKIGTPRSRAEFMLKLPSSWT